MTSCSDPTTLGARVDNGQGYTIGSIGNLGWNSDGMKVAYTDYPGWTFFSTYGGATNNPDWSRQKIFAYELDETKTYSQATGKMAAARLATLLSQLWKDV